MVLKPGAILVQIDLHHLEKSENPEEPEWPIIDWPDPERVDELKVEFCPMIRSRTNEEKSIQ